MSNLEERESLEGEEWKDIPGWEGLYRLSNLGRVLSCGKYKNSAIGQCWYDERILRGRITSDSFRQVVLMKSGYRKNYSIGKLLFEVWGIVPPKKHPVRNCHVQVGHRFVRIGEDQASVVKAVYNSFNTRIYEIDGILVGDAAFPKMFYLGGIPQNG